MIVPVAGVVTAYAVLSPVTDLLFMSKSPLDQVKLEQLLSKVLVPPEVVTVHGAAKLLVE